jgi:PRC-barrel domain protein
MTAPIEDISSLPGKKISDQEENPIGEVKEIYATEDGFPMWVSVEMSDGMASKKTVIIPLARIKDENGDLRVPYSKAKIGDAPEVDASEGISLECDHQLRGYFGIDTGDQEMRSDNKSYAALVPDEPAEAKQADADDIETPDPDRRTDETRSRLEDPGSSEMRKVTAEDVVDEDGGSKGDGGGGEKAETAKPDEGEEAKQDDGGEKAKEDAE